MSDYYLPDYDNEGVRAGRIIGLEAFLATVHEAGEAFLRHECDPAIMNPPVPAKLPSEDSRPGHKPTPDPTPGFGSGVWKITVPALRSELARRESEFRAANRGNAVDAEKTWSFLCGYFFQLCRITRYKYSYYESLAAASPVEVEYIGLGATYFPTEEAYRAAAEKKGIRDAGGVVRGRKIWAAGVANEGSAGADPVIDRLCKFNADQETVHDFGQRNKKTTKYGSAFISRMWAAKATEVYFWWGHTVEPRASAMARQMNVTRRGISHDWWGWSPTVHEAYLNYSYKVLEANSPAADEYKTHSGAAVTLTVAVSDGGDGDELGTTSPAPGVYRYKVTNPPAAATVTALPNQGCRFVCWNEDPGATSPVYSATMSQNRQAVASFARGDCLVYISADANCGTADLQGYADAVKDGCWGCETGASLSAWAYPLDYWRFAGWKDASGVVSRSNPYVWIAAGDVSLSAEFEQLDVRPALYLQQCNDPEQGDGWLDMDRAADRQYWLRVKPLSSYADESQRVVVTGWAKVFDVAPDGVTKQVLAEAAPPGADWVTVGPVDPVGEGGHKLAVSVSREGGAAEVWDRDPAALAAPTPAVFVAAPALAAPAPTGDLAEATAPAEGAKKTAARRKKKTATTRKRRAAEE